MGKDQYDEIKKSALFGPCTIQNLTGTIAANGRQDGSSLMQPTSIDPAVWDSFDHQVLLAMVYHRFNGRTQQELANREHAWRAKNPSWPRLSAGGRKQTCAAMHVRHGDKLTPTWLKLRAGLTHHALEGNSGGYKRSLDEYLDETLHLMNSGGGVEERPLVIVMSDDKDIIDASLVNSRAEVVHVDAPSSKSLTAVNKGTAEFKYDESSSEDFLQWLLTVRLMSACDFFVANFDSSFAQHIFHSVCAERGGSCPRAVTMGVMARQAPMFSVNVTKPQVVAPALGNTPTLEIKGGGQSVLNVKDSPSQAA